MKKINKILLSTTALIVSAFAIGGNNQSSNVPAFEETPTNEVSRSLAMKLAQIDASEEVSVSKTYVQHGEDAEGNRYIRYVTAVKGDIKSLQYVRKCYDLEESQQTATKNVTTVYKGVMENGEIKYFNGTDFDTNPNTDYYLACYQIKIRPESYETYKHHRWEVSLQVDTDGDTSRFEYASDYRTGILEKLTPVVTFNNTTTGCWFYSTDLNWMYNVNSDVDYVVTYDCGELGIVGAAKPENNGHGWSQVITTVENDVYKATSAYNPWFYYKGESNVEIRGFEAEDVGESIAAASNRNDAMDGNPDSYLWVKYPQREDAYIEWTLNEPVDLNSIEILLGKATGGDEFWSTLSVSADKMTYTTIGNVDQAEKFFDTSDLNLSGIKYIRLTNNKCIGSWAAVREIYINTEKEVEDDVEEEISVFSDVTYGGFIGIFEGVAHNLFDNNPETYVRFTKPEGGDEDSYRYIEFELTNPTDIYAIELLNGDSNGGDKIEGHIEVSTNGEDYEEFGHIFAPDNVVIETGDTKAVKFIRVISKYNNTYKALREIRLNEKVESVFSKNVTYGGFTSHEAGELKHLYDGNPETFVRFNPNGYINPDRYVKFELAKPMTIYAIQVLNGDNSLGDYFSGRVLVSSDDVDYVQFGDSFEEREVINVEDYVENVKYIKITSEHEAHWSALREVRIINTTGRAISVTNGSIHDNNISSFALDGDENTFAWYKPVESPSVFTLEFDFFKVQDINTIKILMGKEGSIGDVLINMTFYYSVDGETYYPINEEVEENAHRDMDYSYKFDTIKARYIKVESSRPENHSSWIVIREFEVGMDL